MSTERPAVERIGAEKIIPIIRSDAVKNLLDLVDGLSGVGLSILEITMTTPGALEQLADLRVKRPALTLGAGTVLEPSVVRDAASAGAQFVVSPTFDPDLIDAARSAGVPIIAGTFTPTEAQNAWAAGADLVKIFPASTLGPGFLKALLAPLPHLRLVPTGGLNPSNAADFLDAGAYAVCLGGALIDRESLRTGDYTAVIGRAADLVKRVGARAEVG